MRAFRLLPERFAIVRLEPHAPQPTWPSGSLVSITRTSWELSIVCDEASVPLKTASDRGWRALQLEGTIDLDQTGIAAVFTRLLADAGVAVFLIATFDTDYVLIRESRLEAAVAALRAGGYEIHDRIGHP